MITFFEYINNINKLLSEEISTWDQIEDKELLYKTYFDTYSTANEKDGKGLKPWSKHDFEWRAEKWTFAGVLPKQGIPYEQIGFVTAREKNGIFKLTGMQGPNTKGKIRGLMELTATGKPIWGAMDKDFTIRLKKLGFSSPPLKAMKILLPMIQSDPQFSSGGEWGSLNNDGGINYELSGIGSTIKYFTANNAFYQFMFEKASKRGLFDNKLLGILRKWHSMPEPVKKMSINFLPQELDLDTESIDWFAGVIN